MSNPCINRWGLNTFWHHYWYSDSHYALNLQQDKLILELLQTYLSYGSDFSTNIFRNNYWYKTGVASAATDLRTYYRWITISNETLQSVNTYRLRKEGDEIFQTRINVLKFNSWLVVNLYWFQPDKNKKKRAARTKSKAYTNTATNFTRSYSSITKLRATVAHTKLTLLKPVNAYTF